MLVAKLKTELDKKEKQMDFLKRLAEELNARINEAQQQQSSNPLTTSTPVPESIITAIPLPTNPPINDETLSQNLADLELRHAALEKDFQTQRKQLESIQSRVS